MRQFLIIKIEDGGSGECDLMLQRVITSFVGLAVFFAIVFLGTTAFNVAVCILTLGVLWEIYKAMKVGKCLTVLGYAANFVLLAGLMTGYTEPALIVSIMIFMISTVYLHGKTDFKKIYSTAFITFYAVIFLNAVVKLNSGFGIFAVLPIFACAWMTDVGAYFAGYFFGKHKLIPRVSPKKTVEGAVGGVVSAVLSCLLYAFIVKTAFHADLMGYGQYALLGLITSVPAQFGDLAASVIKRECDIKDFGTIFPGHGGILDRFDSVIFIAPIVYYFMLVITYFIK